MGRTGDVRLNLGMSEANAPGSFVVPKTRLRPRGRSDLSVDGEWGETVISGSFALVARLLVLQKFLGSCDGVSDGRLAHSTSPKIFPSHKIPIANTTSRLIMDHWVGGMSVQTAILHMHVFDVLPPSTF